MGKVGRGRRRGRDSTIELKKRLSCLVEQLVSNIRLLSFSSALALSYSH